MTGANFQTKLDGIIEDLQTDFPNHSVQIPLRGSNNAITVYPLSSVGGVVNAGQLATLQAAVDALKPMADTYTSERAPVVTALESFNTEKARFTTEANAVSTARTTLESALEADAPYQSAKTAIDTARADAGYIAANTAYVSNNVSENFGNLGDARGNYIQT